MRAAILSLMIVGLASPALADGWVSREGNCGEWRGFWRVERDQDNVFVGRIEYEHVGGPCVAATGERVGSDVRAVIAGRDFFATRPGVCNYHGAFREERVRGRALCAGQPALSFALRFLRDDEPREPNIGAIIGGVLNALPGEQRRERPRDEFLDDPRTHQRDDYSRDLFRR
jgi:hypothetical protein